MTNRDTFKKGVTELLLLVLLAEGDKYGYQLSREIKQRGEGAVKIPEGSLYPAMYKLVDGGYVSDEKRQVGKRLTRVYYHLEPSGQARLDDLLREYRIFATGVDKILAGPAEKPNGVTSSR